MVDICGSGRPLAAGLRLEAQNRGDVMREKDLEVFRRAIELSEKWLHLAIYLGYVAADCGADKAEVDRLIRLAEKSEIDQLLLERMAKNSDQI